MVLSALHPAGKSPDRTYPLSAEEMAAIVDDHAAALWRGQEAADGPFYRWLNTCLAAEAAGAPAEAPIAISRLAAGGAGIHWHETATDVVGYVPGIADARYVVSRFSFPHWIRPT